MNRPIHDLYLSVEPAMPTGAGYLVTLRNLQVPGESQDAHVHGDSLIGRQLERRQHIVHTLSGAALAPEALREVGRSLARFLLPPGVRDLLYAVLARDLISGVRIRLRLDIAPPELAELPWELSFIDAHPFLPGVEGFLGLHSRFYLVRQAMNSPPAIALPADPLRVLVAWADPRSFVNHPLLDVVAEANSVLKLLEARNGQFKIQPIELRHATPAGLKAELQARPPHIFHFIGHGGQKQGGGLVLEGSQPGSEAFVTGADLAQWLAGTDVRLVALSACQTAGVAQTLVKSGVAAVLAMQLPWRDATAAAFFRSFYGVLLEPGDIEAALREGREVLRDVGSEWAVPALYRSRDVDLLFTPARPPNFSFLRYPQDPNFCGRERELDELHQSLNTTSPHRIALVGLGGLGKTQLASEYGHRFQQEYPGGVFWINARDSLRIEYAAISHEFGVSETLSLEARAASVKQHLQRLPLPALIICDNVTKDTDLSLLPTVGRCRILATAREEYPVSREFQIRKLSTLTTDSACLLLQTWRQAQGADEEAAVREIAALVGNLPLALALVANHLRRYVLPPGVSGPFSDYLDRLKAEPIAALEGARGLFKTITKQDGAIFDTIGISYRGVSPAAQTILTTATCFGPFSIPPYLLFTACPDYDRDAFAMALEELTDCSLLIDEENDRLSIHALVRYFARSQMNKEEFCVRLERVSGVLASNLAAANRAMDWRAVSANIAHCRSAIDLCQTQPASDRYVDLLMELGCYCYEQGDSDQGSQYLEVGLQIAEQRYGAQHERVAALLGYLGKVRQAQGETARDQGNQVRSREHLAEARYCWEKALKIAQAIYGADHAETFDYYNELGVIMRRQGAMDDAEHCYTRALEIGLRTYGPCHENVAKCLNNIGGMYEAQDRLDEALVNLRHSRSILRQLFGVRETRFRYGVLHARYAVRMNSIGRILRKQGKGRVALARHLAALNIFVELFGEAPHGHLDLAYTYYYLAETHNVLGHPTEARYYYGVAQPMFVYFKGENHDICRDVVSKIRILTDSLGTGP